jgi:hypothetical protein
VQVRPCASVTYLTWCDEAAEAIREHIRAQGYTHEDLHCRLSSIRKDRFDDFMDRKGSYSARALTSFAEASGLELDRPIFRFRRDHAPRRTSDRPRQVRGCPLQAPAAP